MLDITLEQIESVLGEKGRKVGRDYVFQCKVCMDKGKNNLIFSPEKGVLKCFSCLNNEGGQYVLDLINEQNPTKPKSNYVPTKKVEIKNVIPKWELNKEKYVEYMCLTQDYLLNNDELLEYVYKKRGLTKKALDLLGWGFDHTENCFTIPIFSLKYDCITDFELREKCAEKKIRRVGGGCSTIAQIYGCRKAKSLFITEGFIDGGVLYQWMSDRGQKDFTIYSCSNGVASLFNCLKEICFANFNEVKMILDNDVEGDKHTEKIIETYPFIQDKRGFLKNKGVKDICDYYNKFVLATQEGR